MGVLSFLAVPEVMRARTGSREGQLHVLLPTVRDTPILVPGSWQEDALLPQRFGRMQLPTKMWLAPVAAARL